MEKFDIDTPLFNPISNLLLTLVEFAKEKQTYSFMYVQTFGGLKVIPGPEKELTDHHESELGTLESFGFVSRQEMNGQNYVQLKPIAFSRAKYESKGEFGKWWARTVHRMYKGILVITTTISFVLSLGLTIIKIIEAVTK